MFLDFMLLLALIVCIGYCIILTRRIAQLDANRLNLTNMFNKFDNSIVKANENIKSLHETSQAAIDNLSELIDKSQGVSHDLSVMNDLGVNVAGRIEAAVRSNKASLVSPVGVSKLKESKEAELSLEGSNLEELSLEEFNRVKYENKLAYNISQISSPADTLDSKKTLSQNQYFSSLKKINTKNEI